MRLVKRYVPSYLDVRLAVESYLQDVDFDLNSDGLNVYCVNFDDDSGPDQITFKIVGNDQHREKQGIHLHGLDTSDDLEFYLHDALDSCFRDGFTTVYIHKPGVAS